MEHREDYVDEMFTRSGSQVAAPTAHGEKLLLVADGDEFLVVMRRMRTLDEARQKGMAICRAFYQCRYADFDTAACSSGVVLWHGKESVHEIIRRADEAMYAAKISGKGECLSWKG